MNHFKLILTKAIASFILLYVILGFGYQVTFANVLFITLILGAISYIIGDLLILLRTNNTVATISDFFLSFVVLYLMLGFIMPGGPIFQASLISAIGVAVFELFFHMFVKRDYEESEQRDVTEKRQQNYQLQTEVSDELEPKHERKNQHSEYRKTKNEVADELNPDDFDERTGRPRSGRLNDDITDELNPDDLDERK
ncbi:YndM family protein [Alkalibacillus haloalkaliphilus]|uniref:YndM family protein n=1 Tax=Alkalibacillus haloalkaliphilus TaxID=94136 RepID=UPI000A053EF7|nr:YndM family protein [Alkalibacillus haloalkaliphilus]